MLRIAGIVMAIAENAHKELAKRERRFHQAIDNIPTLIWMSDPDGQCTYFNHSWLDFTGVAMQQQVGDGWMQLIHREDRDRCLSHYQSAVFSQEEFTMEYRLRRHDGQYRWMQNICRPCYDGYSLSGYIGSTIEITEHKEDVDSLILLSGKLISAQEEERCRIARELHDDVGQRLALLAIDLDRMQEKPDSSLRTALPHLLNMTNSISDCVRNVSHSLHPASLELLSLPVILQRLCCDFTERTSIAVQLEARDVREGLPNPTKVCLYRIAQECLQNIANHSHATQASVMLTGSEHSLTLTVSDNGVGFDRSQEKMGLGFISIRERLAAVSGTLSITSAPRQGTRIDARVSLEPELPDDTVVN